MSRKVIPIVPRITTASHSRLVVFEQCKHRANLKFAQKLPEPERPLPPGKTEHANDRGTRIHDNAELFVRGKAKLCGELAMHFRPEYERLHELFKDGRVLLEENWAMTADWEITKWEAADAWLRLKLDHLVFIDDYEAVVIDLKTGRRQGNEVKHAEQTNIYQLVTFMRYPKLEKITTELWYPDINDLWRQEYRRDQGLRFLRKWTNRFTEMTNYNFTDEKTDANPSMFTCRYCMYGPKGNSICKRGV